MATHLSLNVFLIAGGTVIALASCANDPNSFLPLPSGGPGSVIALKDAGPSDAAHDVRAQGGATGTGGGGGTGIVVGSGTGGAGGGAGGSVAGASGSAGASGAAGSGAAGSGVVDDPCTACEKAKCSHPVGYANSTDGYAQLVGAYEVCFGGTGWPAATASAAQFCGGTSDEGPSAMSGPDSGAPKTQLCQDLLKCIHQSSCLGTNPLVPNQPQCYCGQGVSPSTCISSGFVATGACKDQVQAALEFDSVFSTAYPHWGNECLANGAAFFITYQCDPNCCPEECLGVDSTAAYSDPTYCNAPGSGGSPGTGGVIGTGGTTVSTGGITGTGGVPATGGSIGSAGGTPGTGGAPVVLFQNGQFESSTAGWTPTFGATIARSSNDAAGSAQSGSLDLVLGTGDPTLSVQVAAAQCVSATGGSSYGLSVEILIPTNGGSAGALELLFYASNDCSGAIAGSGATASSATNAWQKVTGSAQAPAAAHAMSVRLEVTKPYGLSAAEALFDAVQVTPQ
jgi:hypothetical protein